MPNDLSALSISPDARRRRGPSPLVVWLIVVACVCIVALLLWTGLRNRPAVVSAARARPAREGAAAVLNATGYVTPRRRATVSAKITGKIVEVFVEEGMTVEEGDVLAVLDSTDAVRSWRLARADLAVARSALADLEVQLLNARRRLVRQRELRERDLNSQSDLDDAETAVSSLEARIVTARRQITAAERGAAVARTNVDNCVVAAPFAGVVVSKDAQPGEMISPVSAGGGFTRTGIATIVDMASLEIEVDVNESYIARVHAGQRVEAVLDAYPDWSIPASVLAVIPTADRQKATVRVRVRFDELDPRILPDMGIRVSFLEEETDGADAGPVAWVPASAVFGREGSRGAVWIVANERLERRAVSLGRQAGAEIGVTAGLRGGELVVTGGDGLEEGRRVTVEND